MTVCRKKMMIVACTAIVVAFSFQGSRGLYESTEGRYAECAREMIETGNYLAPMLNYQPHWTKPPLTYWAVAGGMLLVGQNTWGARMYLAISFILTALLVQELGAALWDKTTGFVAGLVYATSLFPVFAANTVSTDTLLALWETAAVLCFVKALRAANSRVSSTWSAAMWLFFGMGFFTKGPPSLIPLLPVFIWNRRNPAPAKLFSLTGLVIFVLTALPWYVACAMLNPGLASFWLGHEFIGRVASMDVHNADKWYAPFIMYLPVLLFGAGPWLWFSAKGFLQKKINICHAVRDLLKSNEVGSFLVLWTLLPLAIFFWAHSRLILYVLPIYVPVALTVARFATLSIAKPSICRKVLLMALGICLFLVTGKGMLASFPSSRDMQALYKLCRRFDNKTIFVAYHEDKLMGLQYYLKQPLIRISVTGKVNVPGQEETLQDLINRIITSWPQKRFVIITGENHAEKLEKNLHKYGFLFTAKGNRFWKLYSLSLPERGASRQTPP